MGKGESSLMAIFPESPSRTLPEPSLAGLQTSEKLSRGALQSKRLIIVRAGPSSTHRDWFASSSKYEFDVVVSYYGDGEYSSSAGELVHYYKGGKLEGVFDLFAKHPELLCEYSRIWLPDDDIITNASAIDNLFNIAEARNLQICQPSLSWKSYHSHFITLQNRYFQLRYTNFVEMMVPLFTADALRRVLPLFEGLRFGWGLDEVWCRLLPDPPYRSAIVDAVAVDHLRPLKSGSLYSSEIFPHEERRRLLSKLGMSYAPVRPKVYAGIDATSSRLLRGAPFWYRLHSGWSGIRTYSPQPEKLKKVLRNVRRCALGKPELSPISV
jgi:hypothetical protein